MKSFFNKLKSNTSENRSFVSGASVYFLFNLLSAALQFATIPIFARLMSPEGFGLFGACMAAVALISPLISFGSNGFVGLPIYRREDPSRFIATSLQFIALSFCLSVTVVAALPASTIKISGLERSALLLAIGVAGTQAVNAVYLGVELASRNSFKNAATTLAITALSLGLGLLGLIQPQATWINRIVGIFLAQLIVMFWALYRLGKFTKWNFLNFESESYKRLFLYSVPLLPHLFAGSLISALDRILLLPKVGSYSTGIYAAAMTVSTALELIFVSGNSALVPHIAAEIKSEDQAAAKKRLLRLTIILILLVVTMSALGAGAFMLLSGLIFGEKYFGIEKLAVPLAAASCLNGIYYIFVNYLFLHEKTGRISLVTISSAAIKIGLLTLLIPSYGAFGAAISSIITNAIVVTWMVILCQKVYPLLSRSN
jgi:O-antigen/teichoic acid export membrane protein